MAQVDVDVAAMHAALSLVPGGKRWEGALRRLDHFALTKFHDYALGGQVRSSSRDKPLSDEHLNQYLVRLRAEDEQTFPPNDDALNRLRLIALADLVNSKYDETRQQLFNNHASTSISASTSAAPADTRQPSPEGSKAKEDISAFRTKPVAGPGAAGAIATPGKPFERPWVLTVLMWLYVACSALWLKAILANSMLLSLDRDLLYEREASDATWRVARNLTISANLDECQYRPHAESGRRALVEDPLGSGGELFSAPGGGRPLFSAVNSDAVATVPATSAAPPRRPASFLDTINAAAGGCDPAVEAKKYCEYCNKDGLPCTHINCDDTKDTQAYCHADLPDVSYSYCEGNVIINVTAQLALIEEPVGPLYFVTYASSDWEVWWQASRVDPRDSLFHATDPGSGDSGSGGWPGSGADGPDLTVAPPPPPYISGVGEVSVPVCVRSPGFIYLIGCVVEGFIPGEVGATTVVPPFAQCTAIDGVCGATCRTGVHEPSYFAPNGAGFLQPRSMHCTAERDPLATPPIFSRPEGLGLLYLEARKPGDMLYDERFLYRRPPDPLEMGYVRIDDIEAAGLANSGLNIAGYLFSVMYLLGVFSMFLMYAPALGQKEARAPTWIALKDAMRKCEVKQNVDRRQQASEVPPTRMAPLHPTRPDIQEATPSSAKLAQAMPSLPGMYPVTASISATEKENTVLRNALGKICANLQLIIQLGGDSGEDGASMEVTITDVLVDEGHRLGIFYLYRALAVTFYVALPRQTALQIATAWLRCMNVVNGAKSTDNFDKVNLFDLLDANTRSRSEIVLLEMIHKLVPVFNQFTDEVPLFDKLMQMPILTTNRHMKAVERASQDVGFSSQDFLQEMGLHSDLLLEPKGHIEAWRDLRWLAELIHRRAKSDHASQPITLADAVLHLQEAEKQSAFDSFSAYGSGGLPPLDEVPITPSPIPSTAEAESTDDSGYRMTAAIDSHRRSRGKPRLPCKPGDFFNTMVFQRLGRLIVKGMKPDWEQKGERKIARDVAGYVHHLTCFPSSDALESHEWACIRSNFVDPLERAKVALATNNKFLCFDHVVDVLEGVAPNELKADLEPRSSRQAAFSSPLRIAAVYAARGMPTKWQPETKPQHRRKIRPGVWICEKPNHARESLQDSRLSPVHEHVYGYTTSDLEDGDEARTLGQNLAKRYWASRSRVGLVLEDGVSVAFYKKPALPLVNQRGHTRSTALSDDSADTLAARRTRPVSEVRSTEADMQMQVDANEANDEADLPTFEYIDADKHAPLNVHLGKAGGLNFGLQAVLLKFLEARLEPPSEKRPLFFAITDARHAGDERFWLHTLPPFFTSDHHYNVFFEKSIALVQVAHSYLGIDAKNDALDMRNDFMFTGMAVVRNQAYGMTSCGTGGIWSITTDKNLDAFFFGRTMIEDTASSTEAFLQGRKSIYVTPFANKPAEQQLMCAVPKVSTNFLEALERWDKGAIQCFMAQAATLRKAWFWVALLLYGFFGALFLVPAWWPLGLRLVLHHTWAEMLDYLDHPIPIALQNSSVPRYLVFTPEFEAMISIIAPIALWLFLLVLLFFTVVCAPRTFNAFLRGCVLMFNHTYPFMAFTSVFWIGLPFWIVFTGQFPFRFDPIFAIAGAVLLRGIEWMLMSTYKAQAQRRGTQLREISIFKSQQLNMATVPIKLRAVWFGFWSGIDDVWFAHDNSFWESFGGTPQAVMWVQLWLCTCMLLSVCAVITGIVRIIVQWGDSTAVMACVFGMVLCVINGWMMWQPTHFVMKDRTLKVSLRHTELIVVVMLGVAVTVTFVLSGDEKMGIFAHGN